MNLKNMDFTVAASDDALFIVRWEHLEGERYWLYSERVPTLMESWALFYKDIDL